VAEETIARRIESRLDAIINLLAAPQVKDMTIADAAEKLTKMGLDRDQIAAVCNTTSETVRVALFKKKQNASKPKAKAAKSKE